MTRVKYNAYVENAYRLVRETAQNCGKANLELTCSQTLIHCEDGRYITDTCIHPDSIRITIYVDGVKAHDTFYIVNE